MLGSNSKNGGSGKAGNGEKQLSENFFNQCFITPNPIDQRQVLIHPLPGSGIPMRDYFAALAMQALLQTDEGANTDPEMYGINASFAYRMADAMIVERKRPENNS